MVKTFKKLILSGLLFIPSLGFAQRFGSIRSGDDVALSSNTVLNRNSLQSGSTFYTSSGTVSGQFSVIDPTETIFQKTFPETQSGPKGIVNWIKTNTDGGAGGQYRLVVTTHSNLPAVASGGQSQLRIYPPSDSNTGSIYFFVNGTTRLFVDGADNTMAGHLAISKGLELGYGASMSTLTLSSLISKDCLGTDGSGNVIEGNCTGGGGGGGSSSLAITTGSATNFTGVAISSPTGLILFDSATFLGQIAGGTTYFSRLNSSSVTLQGNNLSATFVTHSSIATTSYLPTSVFSSSVAATYLYNSSASATYVSFNFFNSSAPATYLRLLDASTTYLAKTAAATTYLSLNSAATAYLAITVFNSSAAATYPTISTVSTTYLSKSSASATYLQIGSAGDMILASSQTSSGWKNFTSPAGTTFYTEVRVSSSLIMNGTGPSEIGIGNNGLTTNYVNIRGPGPVSLTENIFLVLPSSRATAGQLLGVQSVDGSTMTLHWDNDGGGAGGSGDFVKASDNVSTGTNTFRGGTTFTSSVTLANISTITYSADVYANYLGTVAFASRGFILNDGDSSNHAGIRGAGTIATNHYTVWPSSVAEAVGQILEVVSISGSTQTLIWGNDGGGAGGSGDMVLATTQTKTAAQIFTSSLAANGPLLANNSVGTSGQLLQSNGPWAAPSWVTASGVGDMLKAATETVTGAKTWTSSQTYLNVSTLTYNADVYANYQGTVAFGPRGYLLNDGDSSNHLGIRGSNAMTANYFVVMPSSVSEAVGQGLEVGSISGSTMTLIWGNDASGSGSGGGSSLYPSTAPIQFMSPYERKADQYTAGAGACQMTSGCQGPEQFQTSVTSTSYFASNFPGGTSTYWNIQVPLPENYVNGSTVSVQIVWASTGATGAVSWYVDMKAASNDDPIDGSWGTAVEIVDSNTASGDLLFSPESDGITIAGSPVGGDDLFIRLYRSVSDSSNTYFGDARFVRLRLTYPVNALSARD